YDPEDVIVERSGAGGRTCDLQLFAYTCDDVVAGVLDVGQQVRRQNQVDAFVVRQIADEIEHLVAPFRVHAVGRLVEEQQIGIVNERLRQLDPLLHAGRVGFDIAVSRLAEADVEQHLVRALHRVDARQAGQLAAVRHEGDRVHAGNVPVGLRHVADARANLERRSGDVETEHAHLSAIGRDETEQRFDHRALPGAVRAEQSDGAAGERGRHVAQRRVPAVHHGYGVERDDRGDAARLSHALDLYAPADQSVPRRPSASARPRMNAITLAICSSSWMPSDSAPALRSSRFPPRANALPELPRVAAHRGFDRHRVFQQAVAFRVLGQERPGVVAIHDKFLHLMPASRSESRATALDTEFHRDLGLYDSTMIVVGSMIGSGIFIVSADMARNIGSPGWLLVAWLVTGALTVVGALSYGELAAMMPRAGGQYVYLREAFSPLWGFLYGWTLFL